MSIIDDIVKTVNELSVEEQRLVSKDAVEKEINDCKQKYLADNDWSPMTKSLLLTQLEAQKEEVDRIKKNSESKIASLRNKLLDLVQEADRQGMKDRAMAVLNRYKELFNYVIDSSSSQPGLETNRIMNESIELAKVARNTIDDSIDTFKDGGLNDTLEFDDGPKPGSK